MEFPGEKPSIFAGIKKRWNIFETPKSSNASSAFDRAILAPEGEWGGRNFPGCPFFDASDNALVMGGDIRPAESTRKPD
jgi:hypothetical protein